MAGSGIIIPYYGGEYTGNNIDNNGVYIASSQFFETSTGSNTFYMQTHPQYSVVNAEHGSFTGYISASTPPNATYNSSAGTSRPNSYFMLSCMYSGKRMYEHTTDGSTSAITGPGMTLINNGLYYSRRFAINKNGVYYASVLPIRVVPFGSSTGFTPNLFANEAEFWSAAAAYFEPYMGVPIQYIQSNCSLTGPTNVIRGANVNVNVSFVDGYGIRDTTQGANISVYNSSGYIPFTYANGVLSFTAP